MNLPPKKYFGEIKLGRSLENYFISISRHSIQEVIPSHFHENPYLSLNIGAAAYLECTPFSKEVIKPGRVILRSAYYEHQNIFERENGMCFNIEVTTKFNAEVLGLFRNIEYSRSSIDIFKILAMSFANYQDDELDCFITESLLARCPIKSTLRTPKWYKRIINKIQDNYDSPLSLSILAELADVHPNYLARKFKQVSGLTVGEYIRMVRLEKASAALTSTKRLTDIAFESGYYDQSHFSNTFRSTFGITPRELRYSLLY